MPERGHGLQAHIAAPDRPVIVLFKQDRAGQARDCRVVRENGNDSSQLCPKERNIGDEPRQQPLEQAYDGQDLFIGCILCGRTAKHL